MRQNKAKIKTHSYKMIIAITALIILGSVNCFSQSNNKGKTLKATRMTTTAYLDKGDPKFISIRNRAVTDLIMSSEKGDQESSENKSIAAKIQTWSKKKQNELQKIGQKAINDYATITDFDVSTFMMVFSEFGKMDKKKIEEEYDLRIKNIGENKYVAEFWEDGLAVNSEANAEAYAHKLAVSEYAKKNPDSDIGNVEVIKKNYADTRKSIKSGKHDRYAKMMALLYTFGKDGTLTFNDPGQPMIDFINNNSK